MFMINKIMIITVLGKKIIVKITKYQQLQIYKIKYFAKVYRILHPNSVLIKMVYHIVWIIQIVHRI